MLAKVPLELDEYLWAQWKCSRLAFVYAPLGFGKSEFAHRMLEGMDVLEVDAATVDVTQAVTAEASEKHDAVLVDNIHDAVSNAQGAALASVISRCTSTRFVFLSRAPMPGWLTPFFAKGELLIVTADDLLFTDTDIAHLLSANGIASTPELVERVANASQRYPLAVAAAIAHIQRDEGSSWEAPLRDEVMAYFEAEFENRFDEKTQDVLLLVPLFDTIDDDLIVHALGEDEGTRLLDALHHATSFITREGHTWKVREGMLNFCKWERARRRNDATVTDIVNRVIEYYEFQGNFSSALDLCSRLSDDERMLAILEDHARLNPGSGSYYELEHYYHELPEDIVLSSPRLMRIMSMLDSMAMCITDSERWYTRLEEYAKAPERTSEERRTAESYLAFLDISLPHRHLTNIVAAVGALAKLHASDNPELVPSVTSGLPSVINGGRDLSPWTPSDDLTARAMSRIVGNALGRLGVGIVEIGLCESKFEKGGDVTPYLARVSATLPKIRRDGDQALEFAAVGIQCRCLIDQGNIRQALSLLGSLRRRLSQEESPEARRILKNLAALRCRIWLRLGETERTHAWLEENAPDLSERLFYMDRYVYLTVYQAFIAEGRYTEARMLMAALSEYLMACDRVIDTIHYDVLTAITHWRSGREEWEQWMTRALARANCYGYARTITQYGGAVLPLLLELLEREGTGKAEKEQLARLVKGARMQASHYPKYLEAAGGLADPLTETELQVLRLICQDKSNAEIGELLGIKLPTVKTHVSHILTKLRVSRRAQAASEARRLRLV